MIVCILMYVALLISWILVRKKKMGGSFGKVFLIVFLCNSIALALFAMEHVGSEEIEVIRNGHGEGSKLEKYEVAIGNNGKAQEFELEISEREYTNEEIKAVFQKVMKELDRIVLGENKSFDRVETDLNLVKSLSDYPVQIQWELDSYTVMNVEGHIKEEHVEDAGTLVEIRGTLSYLEEKVIYVRHAMIYPVTRKGMEKLIYDIEVALQEKEKSTRKDAKFILPKSIEGVSLRWNKKEDPRGYYVIFLGVGLSVFIIYREREKIKRKRQLRQEELLRGYPSMISKFTMLLDTGMTVRNSWERIVKNYEKQKEEVGSQIVYEEMELTLHEMQGGIPEGEAYERFGKRCELTVYLKFGALLSQNLRKGSRGVSDLLRMEAIQSFENRKSQAKRMGEEAGTKLLVPMIGMLAVVLIMVMVPAFMTMQL